VFLLQAQGHRRWQIDARPGAPTAFREGVPLKLLREFEPSHDWVLGPGDMLYLPPNLPHFGEAEDACLTFSLGMRAPSSAELLADYADALLEAADDGERYRDPDLATATDPFEIDAAAMHRVAEALNRLRMRDPDQVGAWFGRFITLYRSAGAVQPPAATPSRIELEWQLEHGLALHRHPWTRTAWRRARRAAQLFVAGESWTLRARDAATLAAAEVVDGALFARLSPAARDVVHALVCAGHLVVATDDAVGDDSD
jgi:50S ribosomal protein L16 3-hydroxylase